jgi:DNA-directed RNA polymerase subunit RPC12/RpoP
MAVTAVIACPKCNKKFKGRDELEGKKVRCPACGHGFIVQTLARDKVEPEKPPPKQEQPARKNLLDDEEDSNPYGVTTLDLTPRCPHCANELPSAESLICLFCGYNTQTRSLGRTKKTIEHTGGEKFLWLLPGLLCALGIVFLFLANLFNAFYVPALTRGAWTDFLDHESMRLWIVMISLGVMWGLGIFMFKRLLLEPRPPEKEMD